VVCVLQVVVSERVDRGADEEERVRRERGEIYFTLLFGISVSFFHSLERKIKSRDYSSRQGELSPRLRQRILPPAQLQRSAVCIQIMPNVNSEEHTAVDFLTDSYTLQN
jgi:hypothetical protein